MPDWVFIILLTAGAGACIPVGGLIATVTHFRPAWLEHEFRHFVIAFGGGLLLGAVSVVLVPQGLESMAHSTSGVPIMFLGALVFFAFERHLGLKRRESPQLMGMVLDYVPEAIALGGLVATGSPMALLLASLIGLQNLPEGFNSFRELNGAKHGSTSKTLTTMVLLVPLGPIAGLLGFYVLADYLAILGAIMLFASGGIIYLIFQDIAPQSRLEKHWAPPIGAVCGFCLALYGEMLVQLA
ncbi:divalent cation transporter [Arenicella chitinivorans]|uniref:Divalent cation transporter n=1 Tax=Arenicella chitinivorans TaxID=1329800 RepID=A0A918RV85_9GAMM|nr:divalent cation transporter [Arenicella chitinivorans]GHA13856.1 divalent cation transporter [Arenicella chitinivorans]